eukprot:1161618-Pelagomonas_calceolata.AAC.8
MRWDFLGMPVLQTANQVFSACKPSGSRSRTLSRRLASVRMKRSESGCCARCNYDGIQVGLQHQFYYGWVAVWVGTFEHMQLRWHPGGPPNNHAIESDK